MNQQVEKMLATQSHDEYMVAKLQSKKFRDAYVHGAFAHLEEGDTGAFLVALRHLVKAQDRGIAGAAEATEISKNGIQKMLREAGDPRLSSLIKVLRYVGYALDARASGR